MDHKIEAPNDEDTDRVARMIIAARQLVLQTTGEQLDGSLDDLERIQKTLDSAAIQAEQTYDLQCIGVAFGKMFIANNDGFDWWMAEDDYGRDPCARYLHTSLLIFPQTMLSKRIEDGEDLDIADLYTGLKQKLNEIIAENFRPN